MTVMEMLQNPRAVALIAAAAVAGVIGFVGWVKSRRARRDIAKLREFVAKHGEEASYGKTLDDLAHQARSLRRTRTLLVAEAEVLALAELLWR